MYHHFRLFLAATLAAASLGSAALAATEMDGKLPIYPKVMLPPGISFSDPRVQKGMAMGIDPLQMTSTDSPATIDAWYRSRLTWCKRESAPSGKVLYTCGDSLVSIRPKGAGSVLMVLPGADATRNMYNHR